MTEPAGKPHPAHLFREEALHHHAQRLHGSVQIYTPMSWHVVGLLLLTLLAAGCLFLSLASYPRVQTVPGEITLEKGVASVAASRAGTISRVSVAEGQTVHIGQELAEIRIGERPLGSLDAAEEPRQTQATQSGFEPQPAAATVPGSSSRALSRQTIPADRSQGYMLIAPVDGVVTAMRARAGAFADPNQPLMTIIPQPYKAQVELFVPSEAAGFISAGDEVKLSLEAYPYLSFGTLPSRVISVAQFPTTRPDSKDGRPVHIVTASIPRPWVEVMGRKRAILPGMTLSARIVTERRTLIEWLFAPLFAGKH
ncbi:HlyD family efflux transporter periplasmic adaptor subunit [Sphingomonas sp. DG1-23]|uniref:HlyD family efflux transporter periplasmic adaptor subunit n=1 Tax=Sphingomonas sp. DG1-23 TaxID=3068316 RepID=UPI00273E001F|nr:HlyD family efflux transporter periplasmic adaptor subunit [Sphingomonas sp. DG1-23]MDP5280858.1 HlyD family efflux transporter periplasmic adaptor subunit [Sphingomonas sp. DG1-23]